MSMDTEQRRYEIAYLISPEVAEDDVVRVAGLVTKIIGDVGGTVRNVTEPKKRHLFYPIHKSRFAYLGVTTFTAGTNAPADITRLSKLEKEVIRLLIVDELKETIRPSGFRASVILGTPAPVRDQLQARPGSRARSRMSRSQRFRGSG